MQVTAVPFPLHLFCVGIELIPKNAAVMTIGNHFVIAVALHGIQRKGRCEWDAGQETHMPPEHGIHILFTVKPLVHDHVQPPCINQVKPLEAFVHCADIMDASGHRPEE